MLLLGLHGLFGLLFGLAWGRAEVYKGVYKMMEVEGRGPVLVTFKSADLKAAHDPQAMLELGQEKNKIIDGMPISLFVSTGKYHEYRGDYVYEQISKHHKESKDILMSILPNCQVASSIPISNSFVLMATKEEFALLEANPNVMEIHTNEAFKIHLPTIKNDRKMSSSKVTKARIIRMLNQRLGEIQWNVEKIGAPEVWKMGGERSKGQGIIYAIADTGTDFNHPNINPNYLGRRRDGSYDHNYAWFDGVRRPVAVEGPATCGFASDVPCDDQGHGTHVTSTAVGANGFGVAPGARWMACRNMDRGVGSPETYLNCLNFFLAPHDLSGNNARPHRRPHVVGNSYGCPESEGCSKLAMNAAVEALRAAGVFMSVSAGNEGPKCSTIADPPALELSVVSVGATDSNDLIAPFSSRGPCHFIGQSYRKPDVCAPGVRVMAAYPGDGYRALSGTSMASPHVGGAVALISAMCPNIARNVDLLQDLLQSTAKPLYVPKDQVACGGDAYDTIPNNHYGYGRVDVVAAIRKCQQLNKRP